MATIAADAILVIHFGYVLFVVAGFAAIWLGAALGWRGVRNFWFRALHLVAIVFVAAEALLGMACPLTVWEDALRGTATDRGFIERWLHAAMFFDWPHWVFTLVYVAFALAVAVTFWLVPPARRRRSPKPL
jgi:polyferredoxin